MWRAAALALILLAAFGLFWRATTPPAPLPLSAPATAFSADRAMTDLRLISRTPHPVGSPANAAVARLLAERLRALCAEPSIDRHLQIEREPGEPPLYSAAVLENVTGVLAGADRQAPALLLMAHYDTVAGSPGGPDDAIGVASLLEILRGIRARGQPRRDVIVLLTDGEEAGMLGARAFFAHHPAARRVGFVINVDVAGSSGRALMYETGSRPAGALGLYARTAGEYRAFSIFPQVAEYLPSDSDFTIPNRRKIPGLNFALIGGGSDYHTASGTAANVDPPSLQGIGAAAGAAAQEVAFAASLPEETPGRVAWGDLLGFVLISYPAWVGWLVLLAAGGLIALAVWRRRDDRLSPLAVLRGAGAHLLLLFLTASVFTFARHAAVMAPDGWRAALLTRMELYEAGLAALGLGAILFVAAASVRGRSWPQLALLALVTGAGVSVFGSFNPVGLATGIIAILLSVVLIRKVDVAESWLGGLLVGLAIAAIVQALAPMAAPVFAWPVLAAALCAVALRLGSEVRRWPWGVYGLLTAATLAFVGVIFHLVNEALDIAALNALTVALAALTLWPLVAVSQAPPLGLRGAAIVLGAGFAVIFWLRFSDPWSERHPQPAGVVLVTEAASGLTFRVNTRRDSPWATRALISGGGEIEPRSFPGLSGRALPAAEVPAVPGNPPTFTQARTADARMRLTIHPPAGVRRLVLDLKPDTDMVGRAAGEAVQLKGGQQNRILFQGPGDAFVLDLPATGAMVLRYSASTDAWPDGVRALPPMGPELMPDGAAGSHITLGERRLSW